MEKLSSHKGMSQILSLIVAASVLMMTALIVVFMAQGSLNDLFSSTNEQGCQAVVESQCGIQNGGTISVPTQCNSGADISNFDNVAASETTIQGSTISCA